MILSFLVRGEHCAHAAPTVLSSAPQPKYLALALSGHDITILTAIAYHQPISGDGLRKVFGRDNRDIPARIL